MKTLLKTNYSNFTNSINAAACVASKKNHRPILQYINLKLESYEGAFILRIAATDTASMFINHIDCEAFVDNLEININAAVLVALIKAKKVLKASLAVANVALLQDEETSALFLNIAGDMFSINKEAIDSSNYPAVEEVEQRALATNPVKKVRITIEVLEAALKAAKATGAAVVDMAFTDGYKPYTIKPVTYGHGINNNLIVSVPCRSDD